MKSKQKIILYTLIIIGIVVISIFLILNFGYKMGIECIRDSDCFCHCCQPPFNLKEATEEKLNEFCSLDSQWRLRVCEARGYGCLVMCAYDACGLFEEEYQIECLKNKCVWSKQ